MTPPTAPKVLYLNQCSECGDCKVWSIFPTRSLSDRHRRNHRHIYGKKHGVLVTKYERPWPPSGHSHTEKKT